MTGRFLEAHTINGVVTPTVQLLDVGSRDQTLEVDASVLNKDIGFVRAGHSVSVKIEAFAFTRYGVIEGTVTRVSDDAIADEKLGLYYSAKVRVKKSTMFVDGVDVFCRREWR